MNVRDAIIEILSETGLSERQLSKNMGMHPRYLSDYTYHRRVPGADNLARIANACGYDLALIRRTDDARILIDPPERPDDSD